MSKTTKLMITAVMTFAFMATGFSADADPWWDPPPSGLPYERLLHERPDDEWQSLSPPWANIQEDNYAAPFQWGGTYTDPDEVERSLPAEALSGASWWVAIDSQFDPADLFASFTLTYYEDDYGAPGDVINLQENVGFASVQGPTETLNDVDWTLYRIGSSRTSGTYTPWMPSVDPGEIIWFSVRANEGDNWNQGESSRVRWLRGADVPTFGAPLVGHAYESEIGEWVTTDVPLAHSQHVVPEPTSMVLLGLGLTGFATRRLISRKKKA